MALVGPVFLDTSVLIAGLIDLGAPSRCPATVLQGVARGHVPHPLTAWHCCLEFFSVSTRLPLEARVTPAEAWKLLEANLVGRLRVLQLPDRETFRFLAAAAQEGIRGGRIYDTHIAEIAHAGGAKTVITDNPRHFTHLVRRGISVLDSAQVAAVL